MQQQQQQQQQLPAMAAALAATGGGGGGVLQQPVQLPLGSGMVAGGGGSGGQFGMPTMEPHLLQQQQQQQAQQHAQQALLQQQQQQQQQQAGMPGYGMSVEVLSAPKRQRTAQLTQSMGTSLLEYFNTQQIDIHVHKLQLRDGVQGMFPVRFWLCPSCCVFALCYAF